MSLPPRLLALMERQHGLVARRQALALGCSKTTFHRLEQRHVLERIHCGVYRLQGSTRSVEQQILAAVLRCGDGALAGGATACALHGLEGFALTEPHVVVVPPARRLTRTPFVVRRVPGLTRAARGSIRGVPTLTAPAALVDVADRVPEKRLRVAVDSARRNRLLSLRLLARTAEKLPELPGAAVILELGARGVLDQDGEGARALAALLAGGGLQPQWEVWVLPGIRVDALFAAAKLVLEYDGRDHHELPTDVEADRRRQRRLIEAGYHVERIRWEDVRDRPQQLLVRIATLLAHRTRRSRG